jgi:hypothetical protein
MTNQEYIDAINAALERLKKLEIDWEIEKLKGLFREPETVRVGMFDESKRFCANCATAYVGTYRCPNCNCGTEAL